MARRRKGRAIDGVLLLNKPLGMTSNQALQRVKRLFFAAKAGHTGSLDPLATGVLPLCFGESTKFSQFLLDADKRYKSTFRLGVSTTTGDAEGEVIKEQSTANLTEAQVIQALDAFRGEIQQIPSMYSALKHEGTPLYKLARKGIEVERKVRQVTIHSLDVLAFRPGEAAEVEVEIFCTKGTYIRSIAEDLGAALGCGAHVIRLHRTASGPFDESQSVTLEALELERGERDAEVLDHHVLPIDAPVAGLQALTLPVDSSYYFRMGNPVMDPGVFRAGEEGDIVRVFCDTGRFLGLGVLNEGQVAPKRLIVHAATAG